MKQNKNKLVYLPLTTHELINFNLYHLSNYTGFHYQIDKLKRDFRLLFTNSERRLKMQIELFRLFFNQKKFRKRINCPHHFLSIICLR